MIKNVIAAYLTAFLNLVGIILWLGAWGLGNWGRLLTVH